MHGRGESPSASAARKPLRATENSHAWRAAQGSKSTVRGAAPCFVDALDADGRPSTAAAPSLERMGFKAWYDNRADDLTKEGMLKGIEEAAAFVLFLSPGVLQRPYCQMEIRHALALGKRIVLIHGERDELRSAQRTTV